MSRRLQNDRGQINFVKIFMFLAAVAVVYLAWVYIPPWLDYFGVRKAVRVGCNFAYSHRDEDSVRDSIMKSWKELEIQDSNLESDGSARKTATPFDRINNIEVEIRKDPPSVTTTVKYTQKIVFPFLRKEKELNWTYSHTEDLKSIVY